MRELGKSGIRVTPVAMGCWPIAGVTSVDVNDSDSIKTLKAAYDSGINFFDTAYFYGANGESERLIATALGDHRDQIVIASKCGIHWTPDGERNFDGSPQRIALECDESLSRLATDHLDLLYLHAPDPNVPVAESAMALKELLEAGKTRSIGVSNFNVEQLDAFQAVCPITAVQPPYNMLQRGIERDIIPWCQRHDASCVTYWPLMKGLLAGKIRRDHVFRPGDGRAKYPMFQGTEWERNQDFVDDLQSIAESIDKTVAELVVAWTVDQSGITAALCGAKRAYQIQEAAGGMGWTMSDETKSRIDDALERRGVPNTRPAI